MAYKLDIGVKTVHGTNPQNLIEHIVRERIFSSSYWKEECFGLNAAALAKRAMNLTYVGGTWGGNRRPTPFLCLLLKLLMIQPEMEIIEAFLSEKDFRYLRLLAAFYLRLVGTGEEIYKCLESLYSDNRKFKFMNLDGTFSIQYIDDFIDQLLTTTRVCDTTLPPLVQRQVLVERGSLGRRVSLLDAELQESDDEDEEVPTFRAPSPSVSRKGRSSEDASPEPSPVRGRQLEERGRTRDRQGSPSHSPLRSISSTRAGFRSPSPTSNGFSRKGKISDTGNAERPSSSRNRSPARSPRRGNRSPDVVSRRGDRSPDVTSRREERSPDAPRSRRGERSPDINNKGSPERHNGGRGRGKRSPDRYGSPDRERHSRRDDRSPGRSPRCFRGDSSPGRRDDYSPDRRRGKAERCSGDADYSRKRSRYPDSDEEGDRYHFPKKSKTSRDDSHGYSERSGPSGSRGSGSSKGGGKGSLREMDVDQMNELRKSIGLGPLKM